MALSSMWFFPARVVFNDPVIGMCPQIAQLRKRAKHEEKDSGGSADQHHPDKHVLPQPVV
jgi:hypothetical protein